MFIFGHVRDKDIRQHCTLNAQKNYPEIIQLEHVSEFKLN